MLGVLQLLKIEEHFQVLVLCPTRELANQVAKEFKRLGSKYKKLRIECIIGGLSKQKQVLKLKTKPPHVIVGTPGRTLELIQEKVIKIDNLGFFIVDECDEVLKNLSILKRHEGAAAEDLREDQQEQANDDVHRHPQREDEGLESQVSQTRFIIRNTA